MNFLLFVLIFTRILIFIDGQKSGFIVTTPNALLSASKENICVSLHNNTGPAKLFITLFGLYSGQTLTSTSLTVRSAECVGLYIPKSDDQLAKLTVRLQSTDDPDLTSNSETQVELHTDPLVILVSTDKPKYKPGQDVLFRIVSLDHKLKPYNGKIDRVWVETPTGTHVEQWTDIEVVQHGLAQLQFKLDTETILGRWKIKVQHNSSKTVEKDFFVKEYTPSTFKVTVKPPATILPDSNNVSWVVCAKYSFGENVEGEAHMEMKLQGSHLAELPSINNVVKLNRWSGCAEVTLSGSELGLSDPQIRPNTILVTATVTEKGTGISHSSTVESPVYNQPFLLHFECSHYFKPGLPYKGNIMMTTMDGHPRRAIGEKIQICIKVRYRRQLAMRLIDCWDYTTDFKSEVVFALPDIPDAHKVQLISIIATATEYPTKSYPESPEVMVIQPTVTQNVKPWFSPSHSYLDVFTRTSLACGTAHGVTVYYSVSSFNDTTPTFFYLLESRGDLLLMNWTIPLMESVVHSNEIESNRVNLVRSWRLELSVTPDMAPLSTLTVYYVRTDGEVVAASTRLLVDRCFHNKVHVRWSEHQLRPREPSQLLIRGSPHSICAVSVVDKQIMFNLSHNEENVWYSLGRFNLPKTERDQRSYCIDKVPEEDEEEETPPTYELRKRRSMSLPPKDYSEHVDAITAFDDVGMSVMSNLKLESRPCTKTIYPDEMMRRSWRFPQNILHYPQSFTKKLKVVEADTTGQLDRSLQSLARDYFPDTWIWSLAYIGKDGEAIVNDSTPDSITSWDTRVMCISEKEGLGISAPSSVSVFQPFFIHVEAPYSMKMNEKVMIKVVVYNYMHHLLPIKLRFFHKENLMIHGNEEASICLKELSQKSHMLAVEAKMAGTVNLTVEAHVELFTGCDAPDVPLISDKVVKQLSVTLEGFPQQTAKSAFICPSESQDPSVSWELMLPQEDNLVSGSAQLQFSVMADLFGPALENLDRLVLLPMGCGEQNLAKLAPNLYVLKYLNATGSDNDNLKSTALKNIKKGYQRQLLYRRSDGSFSAFGDKDDEGSMWLTASVVKTFSDLQGVIDVDKEVLKESILWITSQQLENGCFPVIGQVFHLHNDTEDSGRSTSILSAFIMASLAGSGAELTASVRSNAELCLKSAISQYSTDPHILSIATLALVRLGYIQQAKDAYQNLMRLAVMENDFIHWGKPDTSLSENILSTSYAVLSILELKEDLVIVQRAVRWISSHRNENGGFVSTQDTVVALEALVAYMRALPPVDHTELMVIVRGGNMAKSFRLSEENKLVQQRLVITDNIPPLITATVVGNGCALIQNMLKYRVRRPTEGSQLQLEVSTSKVSTVDPCSVQQLRMCSSASQAVNMALLTILMVTGYSVDIDHLHQISHPHIKKWEEEDGEMRFYLTNLNSYPICFTIQLVRKFEVEDPLPAPVNLIDYYHPEISTSKSYSIECSPETPIEEPYDVQADSPATERDQFANFHNVDFDLDTPDGNEGPKPVFTCPPNSTLPDCKPVP